MSQSHAIIPPYFSWVVDKLLAISAYPYHHTHLKYLTKNGIHTVVSINDDMEPPFHTSATLKCIRLNVPTGGTPTITDCHNFVALMEKAKQRREGILVHSLKATGRAAVLVGCYLIKTWECPADYVINNLRIMRPVSIENAQQESILQQYHDSVCAGFEGYYARKETSFADSATTQFLGHAGGDSYGTIVTCYPPTNEYEAYEACSGSEHQHHYGDGTSYPPKTFDAPPYDISGTQYQPNETRIVRFEA